MRAFGNLKWLLTIMLSLLLGAAHAANIYWKPNSGNDANNGQSAAKAVKTFDRAKSLVTSESDWIIICEICNITSDTELDGSKGTWNVKIKRNGNASPNHFFSIAAGKSLQLMNVSLYGGISGSVFNSTPPSTYGNSFIFMNQGSTFVMETGTVLRDNWTTYGPAIKAYDGGTIHIKGGLITNCGTAHSGGAIYLNTYTTTPATFIMEGGEIKDCLAGISGGAICFNNPKNNDLLTPFDITISGGEISNCMVRDTSHYGGGAIYIESKLTQASNLLIEGGAIKQCSAYYGGAIDARGNVSIDIDDGLIQSCTASNNGYGGGIYMYGLDGNAHLNIDGGLIKLCSGYGGGGIYMNGNDTLVMSGGVIDSCSASSTGGGVNMNHHALLTMSGGEISNCSATNYGGGAHVGGFSLTDRATLVMENGSSIHHCTTSGPGGGLNLTYINGIIRGSNTQLHHNHCYSYGGAIKLMYSQLEYFDGEIYSNTAGDVGSADFQPGGGGLHVSRSTFIMTGGKIYGNLGIGVGGAIHASHGSGYEIRLLGGIL